LSDQSRRDARFFAAIERQALKTALEPTVVQLLDIRPSAALPLWRLRQKGIRSIFTHTLLGDLSSSFWRRQLQKAARRLPLELVDCLVVSSGVMKERIRELGVKTPVEVIPNGVDLQRFHPAKDQTELDALKKKLGLGLDWTTVLAVGPVIPRKGADVLIDAFTAMAHRHPGARLVMVGPRHDLAREELQDFRTRIEGMLRERSAIDKVVFTGPVANVEEYVRCSDILVFPSLREGMPNVPLEAMASGVPVIMTPFIGMPSEFGTPGRHFILSDYQSSALSNDIESVLQSPQRRQELGERGRRHVQDTLALEHSLGAYASLYRALCSRR
jgi:glycosyltransferase involved in cell wall biosynthesis